MNRIKNHLIAAAVLSVLAVIGTIMNSHQAAAQAPGPPDGLAVRVVNPLPVPVTGSTTVSGSVAATESGTWNVGVTGTPNVAVTNTITAPVPTLDISKSASHHVTLFCGVTVQPGCFTAGNTISTPYVVPAGQNLVVTSVDIISSSAPSVLTLNLIPGVYFFSGGIWSVPGDELTHSFQYPGGIVVPAGYSFTSPNLVGSGQAYGIMQGFLTSN